MTVQGFDLSYNQVTYELVPLIDQRVVRFAFARASLGYVADGRYFAYRSLCRAAGIPFGSYHALLRHDPPNDSDTHPPMVFDPVQQAQHFASLLDDLDDLPAVVDVEAADVTDDELWAFLMEFQRLKPTTEIIIYTSQSAWYRCVGRGKTRYRIFRLWLADYSGPLDFPDLWTTCLFHQSTGTGRLPGYDKNLDLDEFIGSEADWTTFLESVKMTSKRDKQALLDQVNSLGTQLATAQASLNVLSALVFAITPDDPPSVWWTTWPEGDYNPPRNLGVPPAAVIMRDGRGLPLAGIKPRSNRMDAFARQGDLFLVANVEGVNWYADAHELLAQPQG